MGKKKVSIGGLLGKLLGPKDRRNVVIVIRPDRTRIGPPAPVRIPK